MWAGTSSSNPASPTTAQPIPSASRPAPNYRLKNQGKRVAQIVKLKKEYVEEYRECHAKVWPEVLKQIKDSNIEDLERMKDNPKVQEWWRMTDSFQESFVPGAKNSYDGEPPWWKGVEEVFYTP
ncbi:hypothetical protein B2J93_8683 [Marssonina coronariae]|uniref:Uncharacterized protein n=1 Tax=Diplocarpon coronariae TaxID=2795749 RepID=A0A218YXB8_9HELO|nr:hypothetical protein B2J93_8683 [Marssonina coronariae]